jgi:endonuclease-8
MRLAIATGDFEAVGFNIPVAEFIPLRRLERLEALSTLGPDLLGENFDQQEALRRIRERGEIAIADALLNQHLVAGIGNVYKSEVLFLCRIHPFVPVRSIDDRGLVTLMDTARALLRANVSERLAPMTTYTGFRRTTGRNGSTERLWVYGRARLPCRRCGTAVAVRKDGVDARLTYWCPTCQAA